MYTDENGNTWKQYLETIPRGGSPIKLDRILKRRMREFMKARKALMRNGIAL
jgi:hypothetical protein